MVTFTIFLQPVVLNAKPGHGHTVPTVYYAGLNCTF